MMALRGAERDCPSRDSIPRTGLALRRQACGLFASGHAFTSPVCARPRRVCARWLSDPLYLTSSPSVSRAGWAFHVKHAGDEQRRDLQTHHQPVPVSIPVPAPVPVPEVVRVASLVLI